MIGLLKFNRYDVTDGTIEILAIVAKPEAQSWLAQYGNPA